jgi:hypothetical protein
VCGAGYCGARRARPQWFGERSRNPCRKTREESITPKLRAKTRLDPVLGERGRRVFETTRADKRRCDPDRMQGRDKTELENRNSNRDQRPWLLIIAGTGERDGAFMAGRPGIRVDQLVPPRHHAEREHREEAGADRTHNEVAKDRQRRPHFLLHRRLHCPVGAQRQAALLRRSPVRRFAWFMPQAATAESPSGTQLYLYSGRRLASLGARAKVR